MQNLSLLLSGHPPFRPSQAHDTSFLHVPHSLCLLIVPVLSLLLTHPNLIQTKFCLSLQKASLLTHTLLLSQKGKLS